MASAKTLPLARDRAIRAGFYDVADPGASGTLSFLLSDFAIFKIVTAAAESRALPAAGGFGVGTRLLVVFKTDGGDLTITGADQSVVLRDAGDVVEFVVTDVNGTLGWRVVADSRVQSGLFGSKTVDLAIANNFRTWDALITNLPATKTTDDLGLVTGTFLTGSPTLNYTQATPSADSAFAREPAFVVPADYKAGTNLTLDVTVAENVAGDTVTVDAQVVRRAAPSVDICATAAQSVVGAAAGIKSFTLTGTNVVPGEVLDIRLQITATSDTETPNYAITKVNIDYNAG